MIDMPTHKFHKMIGRLVKEELANSTILMDSACTENNGHNLPLFYSSISERSSATEFCDADILIIKDDKVKVIIEIEESNIKPMQIFGKIFSASLARYYNYREKEHYELADKLLFIQVLDNSKLSKGSYKEKQWKNVEKAIHEKLPVGAIAEYRLFYGNVNSFNKDELIKSIKGYLSRGS